MRYSGYFWLFKSNQVETILWKTAICSVRNTQVVKNNLRSHRKSVGYSAYDQYHNLQTVQIQAGIQNQQIRGTA